ncbi:hypothetical protein [Pseudobutyrivibrio sp.]|jgi:hypothetical protein|uniref:hypothetical protein n=1 Tax=Pseudobutyrivibrio sp. TaxID=2014367 RepID=UPI0025FBE0C4|nr:hypothetical protein [Pseudobutyrivibrio sp.]
MYQICDVLTGEHLSRKNDDDMVRVEKIAKVKVDKEKKEIYELTTQAYGFSKKGNIENIEDITADWKNYLFAGEKSKDGSLFAVRFAIRGAEGALTVSVATKMFASVLKMTDEAVWFQTGIHGSLNSLSKNIKRFQNEGVDVFGIVILTYDANRNVLKAFPSSLGELLIKIEIIRNGGGRGLKTVDPVFDYKGKTLSDSKNVSKKTHDKTDLDVARWEDIKKCFPKETKKMIDYAELLAEEMYKCKEQIDLNVKNSISKEAYDMAQDLLEQSKYLQERLDVVKSLIEK